MPLQPKKLVYFYADEDQSLVEEVKKHLNILQRLKRIEIWSTRNITAGFLINQEIINVVEQAEVILYFFSAEFINSSDYSQLTNLVMTDGQLLRDWIWNKNKTGDLHLIPILLNKFVGFEDFQESELDVLLRDKPLGSFQAGRRKAVCCELGETIKKILDEGKTASRQAALTTPPAIPTSLLPHLCARVEQDEELQRVFNKYKSEKKTAGQPGRPLVCVIHGHIEECPEGYKERLEKRDIYEFLQIDYEHPIKIYNLGFPNEKSDLEQPAAFFDKKLKESFYETPEYNPAHSLSGFLNHFQTVIINYDAFSENWDRRIIKSFLDFWNKFPVENIRATIVVNLFFSYDENSDSDIRSNSEARAFFTELKQNEFAEYPNITGAVTPELDAIEKTEVIEWLNDVKVFRGFCKNHTPNFCNKSFLQGEINKLYSPNFRTPLRFTREIEVKINERAEIKKITLIRMQTLGDKLGKLIIAGRKSTHKL